MTEPRELGTDAALRLIADRKRRNVLRYLSEHDADWVRVSELARSLPEMAGQSPREPVSDVVVELHHIHLPKLAEAGVVDYDPDARTVRYHEHAKLEALLAAVADDVEESSPEK